MPINRLRMYAGPLGYVRALSGHPSDAAPDASLVVPGAAHVSLAGRSTFDRSGRVRRIWNLSWRWIPEEEETFLQSLLRRSAGADIRFMDPRKRNLAPEDTSTGGSSGPGISSFTKAGGAATLAWSAGSVPADLAGVVSGRLVWNGVANTDTLYSTFERTPILPGSTYTISMYVKTTTTFRFSARPFDQAGAEQAAVTDATNQASTAGVWARRSWLYTPAAGVHSAYFGLTATGAGNIETTGWQYQIDQPLAAWAFGYGCPVVRVAPAANAGYFKDKYHNLQLQILEV